MSQKIKITVIASNTVKKRGLLAEHGAFRPTDEKKDRNKRAASHSKQYPQIIKDILYAIQTRPQTRILFDSGQGLALENNLEAMNIDPAGIHSVALSHGHYDHTGGLEFLIKKNPGIEIYLHPEAPGKKYKKYPSGKFKDIGMTPEVREAVNNLSKSRLHLSAQPKDIFPGITLTGEIPRVTDFEDAGGDFFLEKNEDNKDEILDDQSLFFETPEGLFVILGCAHAGVVNILKHIQKITDGKPIYGVMGGMHLVHADDHRISHTINFFRKLDIRFLIPGHCTGETAVHAMKLNFPDQFRPLVTGETIELEFIS